MNLRDAIDASTDGRAVALTDDGRIIAEVWGPGHWMSKRKRKKRSKGVNVTIWSPPRPAETPYPHLCKSRIRNEKLHEASQQTRRFIESLDWRPHKAQSAIDRLAKLIRKR